MEGGGDSGLWNRSERGWVRGGETVAPEQDRKVAGVRGEGMAGGCVE